MQPKKIAIVSAELSGVAPVGGVAEYVAGLAFSLIARGHDVRVILPQYGFVTDKQWHCTDVMDYTVWPGHHFQHAAKATTIEVPNPAGSGKPLNVVLVGRHPHFEGTVDSRYVYAGPGLGTEPWEEFSRAAVDYLRAVDGTFRPDVIHCQDPHTGMVPVFIKQMRLLGWWTAPNRLVFTVHNLSYQGRTDAKRIKEVGIEDYLWGDVCTHFGDFNTLKAALYASDCASTVSYTYADEICGPLGGAGIDGPLADIRQRGRLWGIVNGVDEEKFAVKGVNYYSATTPEDREKQRKTILAAKKKAKSDVVDQIGWPASAKKSPIVSMRGRFDVNQKGMDAFISCMEGLDRTINNRLLERARVIVVTWAVPDLSTPVDPNQPWMNAAYHWWGTLLDLADRYPDRIALNPPCLSGSANLAQHYLASDFFVMPSRWEPCGLIQMECQRYGTIPIVRRTGGLADTVSEGRTDGYPSPNGYTFDHMNWEDIMAACGRAVDTYYRFQNKTDDHHGWMIDNCLLQQNGWRNRIPVFESFYGF